MIRTNVNMGLQQIGLVKGARGRTFCVADGKKPLNFSGVVFAPEFATILNTQTVYVGTVQAL